MDADKEKRSLGVRKFASGKPVLDLSLNADTTNDLAPSVSRLYFGQTKVRLPYRELVIVDEKVKYVYGIPAVDYSLCSSRFLDHHKSRQIAHSNAQVLLRC